MPTVPVVRVRLFAVLREIAGAGYIQVAGATAGEVRSALSEQFGEKFAAVAARSSLIVDGERATPETPLTGSEEVAILPPVSGGAAGRKKVRHLTFIANPRARSYSRATVELVEHALAADFDVSVVHTTGRGSAKALAEAAVAGKADVLVVFSGDGTINEAVNGLVGTDTALGIIPGGATNVYARILGIPPEPIAAANRLIRLAASGEARRIPVGSANGRVFVMNCGVGLDAAVMRRVEQRAPRSKLGHEREAFMAAVQETQRYLGKRHRDLTVRVDDNLQLSAVSVLIAKAHPYAFYKSFGLKLHPDAELTAGLDVLAIQELPRLAIPKVVYELFLGGKLMQSRYVEYSHDTSRVEIVGESAFPVQLDGEYVGEFEALDVQLERDALWVVA